jgi:hypothetical protein
MTRPDFLRVDPNPGAPRAGVNGGPLRALRGLQAQSSTSGAGLDITLTLLDGTTERYENPVIDLIRTEAVRTERAWLGNLTQADVAERGGPSTETLRLIEGAKPDGTAKKILTGEMIEVLGQLRAQVAAVRALHRREMWGERAICGCCFGADEDPYDWPCPTIAALDGCARP